MQDLGTLGGQPYSGSYAYGINASGQVVGNSDGGAFLWNSGTMHNLNTVAPAGVDFSGAGGINDAAQIAATTANNEAVRVTLHPDWEGGDGNWSDAAHWNFAGMGSFGITPGQPHDVVINPTGSATVFGPWSGPTATVNSLVVAGNGANLVTLNLVGGGISAQQGTTLGANGTLGGTGRLAGGLAIQNGGRVNLQNGDQMQLAGQVALASGGRIDVRAVDTESGRPNLEIGGGLASAAGASVNLMNADLYVSAGIANAGRMSITGLTTVSGVVNNQTGGQVNISGAGTPQAIFWDNFTNNGSVNVTTATFFGRVNGAGSFVGSGTKQFAGGYSPGNSPALVTLEGEIDFLSSTIDMELGGTTPGTEHDKIIFTDPVAIANAILNVQYWGGWTASGGEIFDLFDWNGAQSERFASVLLPALSQGLFWDTDMLYTSGELSVATPAPPAVVLLGTGLMGVIGFRRRRLKASMAMDRDRG
jgi:probable HAF family extracellular repeat protein